MRKEDKVRLRHMLDAAREVVGFARSRTRADLDLNRMLVLSLVKAIEVSNGRVEHWRSGLRLPLAVSAVSSFVPV